MFTEPRCHLLILCLALVYPAAEVDAQVRPTLDLPAVNSGGGIKLSLHGDAGSNYSLEISRNLNAWLPLSSLMATNGQADFLYSAGTNNGAVYFRGRLDTRLPSLSVSVQTDTNDQAVTLLTPEDGGAISLADVHGIIYSLIVPSNAVFDGEVVTMTVATNVVGLPFGSGLLGAVSFDPDGLALAQPAQLVIQFLTNTPIDLRKVVAYGFAADGSQFHLTPSIAATNSLIVPLTSLSGIGCSLATLQEILQQGQRMVSDANATPSKETTSERGHSPKGAYYNSCYPAEKTRAVFVGKGVENALNAVNQAMAERMDANSQLSSADQLMPGQLNLEVEFNNFYRDELAPYAVEMQTNCALAGTLFGYYLSVERQAQLMGIETQPPSPFLGPCTLFSDCAKKIDDCCKTRGASQAALIELLELSRQWQLIGCESADPWNACPDCLPVWYGTVKYEDVHTAYEVISADGEVDSQYRFTATLVAPTNLIGSPTGQGYYGITGNLGGPAEGKNRVHSFQASDNGCYSYVDTLRTSAISTSAVVTLQLVWSITNTPPGPPRNGLLLFPDSTTLATLASVPALATETDANSFKDQDGNCQLSYVITDTHPADTYMLQQQFYNSDSITGTVNDVTGTASTNWTALDGSQWTRSISWDLHRKQGP